MPRASRKDIEAARTLVRARDDFHCQMCGKPLWIGEGNTHHRLNKGRGGSAVLERASVLITACGSGSHGCHGAVTENPDWARSIGWLLPRNNPDIDPEQEPILTYQGWRLLADDGTWSACESPLLQVGGD